MTPIEQAEAALNAYEHSACARWACSDMHTASLTLIAEHKRLLAERTVHDDDTLEKVYEAIYGEGYRRGEVEDIVNALQNAGILFRERPKVAA